MYLFFANKQTKEPANILVIAKLTKHFQTSIRGTHIIRSYTNLTIDWLPPSHSPACVTAKYKPSMS